MFTMARGQKGGLPALRAAVSKHCMILPFTDPWSEASHSSNATRCGKLETLRT